MLLHSICWQVSNWFINARVRLWKPMVEEMYTEEMKDPQQQQQEGGACSNANNPSTYGGASDLGQGRGGGEDGGERKPTRAQLVHDAGSLASVVSIGSSSSRDPLNINFGMMDGGHHLDFGAYNDGHAAGAAGHGFGGGGVSLTLGLQQHAGDDPHGGVNVAFAAAPSGAHEFLFMAGGEHQQQMVVAGGGGVHGHQQAQFGAGMHEGDAVATSHYHRGLNAATGFQLLHDLAG